MVSVPPDTETFTVAGASLSALYASGKLSRVREVGLEVNGDSGVSLEFAVRNALDHYRRLVDGRDLERERGLSRVGVHGDHFDVRGADLAVMWSAGGLCR